MKSKAVAYNDALLFPDKSRARELMSVLSQSHLFVWQIVQSGISFWAISRLPQAICLQKHSADLRRGISGTLMVEQCHLMTAARIAVALWTSSDPGQAVILLLCCSWNRKLCNICVWRYRKGNMWSSLSFPLCRHTHTTHLGGGLSIHYTVCEDGFHYDGDLWNSHLYSTELLPNSSKTRSINI